MSFAEPSPSAAISHRVQAGGKYLRLDGAKWQLNGVSYGPFKPNSRSEPFPDCEQLAADFARIRAMGFNCVRIYDLPSQDLLRLSASHDLRLIVGIPWTDHVDFLNSKARRREIEERVRTAARTFGSNPQVAALLVGNEIEKTLVRWMGPQKVKRFLERLIAIARDEAPRCLITYATYPSTEYLLPANADFVAVNVYLEDESAFVRYLKRLQNLSGNRPLVITEFGLDALRHGDAKQAEIRRWQMQAILREGVAGNVWFAFTDEWFRGGSEVTDWGFGLLTKERTPKPASVPFSLDIPPGRGPLISVVVCTRNGSATLAECLKALQNQTYQNYEVIVVDDGSTDSVPEIAKASSAVRYERQDHAGLSVARNLGLRLARGEIVAYTDDDCMADEDWLSHLAMAFDDPQWVAAGGPNIPPPPRNLTEAIVAAAPGGPSHVLLNDEEAEHLPGCNLAIRKSALEAIGGFRPQFMAAGDDVDVCWRLREAGGKLKFVPGAMVWHHRRFSVRAFLRQQRGYGWAEALLMKAHPLRFGSLGGARWRGLIYGNATDSLPPTEGSIFHGPFGGGLFQVIYTSSNAFCWFDLFSGLLWIAVALLLVVLKLPIACAAVCGVAAFYAWQRMAGHRTATIDGQLMLWFLCLVQPVVREWARLKGMIVLHARPGFTGSKPYIRPPRKPTKRTRRVLELAFWSESGVGREAWMQEFRALVAEEHLTVREDDGWRWFDFELFGTVGLASVTEYHGGTKQLTRVAISRRSQRRVWPVLIFVPILCAVVAHYTSPWIGVNSEGFGTEMRRAALLVWPVFVFGRLFMWPMAKSKARELTLKAGEKAGLQWIKNKDQAVSAIL